MNISSVAGSFSASSPMRPIEPRNGRWKPLSETIGLRNDQFGVRVIAGETRHYRHGDSPSITIAETTEYPHAARISVSSRNTANHRYRRMLVARESPGNLAESTSWQLRHPVGPDAVPLIEWRKSYEQDEQWIDLHSADEENYRKLMGTAAAAD